jgi:ABC-2 type transport system ATP-binding protein
MTNYAVELDRLRVVRGRLEVLRGISTRIQSGSVTGVLGPSGCGKTTMLRCIVGAQIISGGTVRVLDAPAGNAGLRGRIGYATQTPAVYADLTVRDNLRYFARVLDVDAADVDRVLEAVGLTKAANQLAGRISGGQRSRASLGVALLGKPELLVLDEPTVGVDPVLRAELWQLFHTLAAAGATLLISSHVMDEAARCDRLLLMRDGQLLADDTPAALRQEMGSDDLEQVFLRLVGATSDTVETGSPA